MKCYVALCAIVLACLAAMGKYPEDHCPIAVLI